MIRPISPGSRNPMSDLTVALRGLGKAAQAPADREHRGSVVSPLPCPLKTAHDEQLKGLEQSVMERLG